MSGLGSDAAPARVRSATAGFTLVELTVALVLFAFGTLGLASMAAGLQRQTTLASLRTERSAALVAAVERVRAFDFDSLANGNYSSGPFNVTWSVVPSGRYVKNVQVVTIGPGLTNGSQGPYMDPAIVDTVDYTIVRP